MARRSTRETLLAYQKQADNDLDRFLVNAKKMQEIYEQSNPHHAEAVYLMASSIINIQKLWQRFRDEKM